MVFSSNSRAAIHQHDRQWFPKFILHLVLTVFCIVSIGCIAWAVANRSSIVLYNFSTSFNTLSTNIVWALIPLSLSVIWSFISLLNLIARKKPVHPGFNVGFDLILWLAFVVTAVFATAGSVLRAVDSSYDSGYTYDPYYQDPNPYTATAVNGTRVTVTPDNAQDCPLWNSCADEQSYNAFEHRRAVIAFVGAIFLCIASLLQFTLFVWACVDTYRYRRQGIEDRARLLADKIILDMQERGELQPKQRTSPTAMPATPTMVAAMARASPPSGLRPSHQEEYNPPPKMSPRIKGTEDMPNFPAGDTIISPITPVQRVGHAL